MKSILRNIFTRRHIIFEARGDQMSKNRKNNEQNEESAIAFSLQLQLTANVIGLIGHVLSLWALLEIIEEERVIEEEVEDVQAQNGLDGQLEEMQAQIDRLTKELAYLKRNLSNYKKI